MKLPPPAWRMAGTAWMAGRMWWLCNALADGGGVIHPQRGAELVGEGPQLRGREGVGHGAIRVLKSAMMPWFCHAIQCFDFCFAFILDMLLWHDITP